MRGPLSFPGHGGRTRRSGPRAISCSSGGRTTTPPAATSAGPSWASSTGRSTGSTRSRSGTTGRRCASSRATGASGQLTFAQMSDRSAQVANWLRAQGVRRGDRLILMLGNQVELWETILAAMKLGAVLIPATTLLGPEDLVDRVQRGDARHVVTTAADAAKFASVPGGYTRIAVGGAGRRLARLRRRRRRSPAVRRPTASRRRDDPLLLYFTSGTTAQPKLVEHTHASYPAGHLSTMYWIGLRPGDVHLNVSSPGWAKHAWSNVFAPWNAEATVLIVNQARFSAAGLLDQMVRCGVTTFCAPPTVWRMLIQEDLDRLAGAGARARRRRRAAEPRGDRAGAARLGAHDPRRLRPDRDDRPDRQPARPAAQARLDGAAAARLHRRAGRPASPAPRPTRARSRSTCATARSRS